MRRPLKHPHLNPLPQGEEREQLIEVSRWRRMTVACLRAHFSNCARHRPFVPLSFSLPLGEKVAQRQARGKEWAWERVGLGSAYAAVPPNASRQRLVKCP